MRIDVILFWPFLRSLELSYENPQSKNMRKYPYFGQFLRSPIHRRVEVKKKKIY